MKQKRTFSSLGKAVLFRKTSPYWYYALLLIILLFNKLIVVTFLFVNQEHIHDVNAYVRSKALHIWLELCKEKVTF